MSREPGYREGLHKGERATLYHPDRPHFTWVPVDDVDGIVRHLVNGGGCVWTWGAHKTWLGRLGDSEMDADPTLGAIRRRLGPLYRLHVSVVVKQQFTERDVVACAIRRAVGANPRPLIVQGWELARPVRLLLDYYRQDRGLLRAWGVI